MKIITINIPDQYCDAIQAMVDLGLYESRSDFVREAIKDFLITNKQFESKIPEDLIFELFRDLDRIDLLSVTSNSES